MNMLYFYIMTPLSLYYQEALSLDFAEITKKTP